MELILQLEDSIADLPQVDRFVQVRSPSHSVPFARSYTARVVHSFFRVILRLPLASSEGIALRQEQNPSEYSISYRYVV